jgi:hypothetical protein
MNRRSNFNIRPYKTYQNSEYYLILCIDVLRILLIEKFIKIINEALQLNFDKI